MENADNGNKNDRIVYSMCTRYCLSFPCKIDIIPIRWILNIQEIGKDVVLFMGKKANPNMVLSDERYI